MTFIMAAGFHSGGKLKKRLVKRPIDGSESLKPCLTPPEAAVVISPHNTKELTEKGFYVI